MPQKTVEVQSQKITKLVDLHYCLVGIRITSFLPTLQTKMNIETDRYRITIEEISEGGPGGYESTYLASEGDPATEELYNILAKLDGTLLPANNRIIRQRNGQALIDTLRDEKSLGIASGFKPSGAFHFGHRLTSGAVSFFQKNGVQVFVPVADIECAMDPKLSDDEYQFWAADNILDWGANGVNLDAAHVYLQSEEFRVSGLAYLVARSLSFKLATDIYGAQKMIDDFPFLFAGVTQVGDILLPQHQEFGNLHSFMLSGQDQDGHMKMTVALVEETLSRGTNALANLAVPSGFYIPHIRGTDGEKMSSSNPSKALFLGAGPDIEDLTDRIRSTTRKLDEADQDNLERCSLDLVRYMDFFNVRSKVSFGSLSAGSVYQELQSQLDMAKTKEEQRDAQYRIDEYLLMHCRDQKQDNTEIVRDLLSEALKEHHNRRRLVLEYAKARASYRPVGGWGDAYDSRPTQPRFWRVPDNAIVDEDKRNSTQWFHIIDRAANQIIP